ncbi:MAG: GTPase HflX [Alphaproteobacteria bacterium]|nr:GTPase HflX [Alphaproteobacteria bacterium]
MSESSLDSRAGTTGRALVIHPHVKRRRVGEGLRTPAARLDEIVGLARAIELEVVEAEIVVVARRRPATLFGSGKVAELGRLIAAEEVQVVVVDGALSPIQQRNLERAWNAKVIDRTGLILENFGARARTREGRLQVELAALSYARSRLVRSWTHLERQRGGLGFVGGPGETQIEADRRMIGERITRLRRRLDGVIRTRTLHRLTRRKDRSPVVALLGYTNAGKSTLFNGLTQAGVLVDDILFATLDPTMRGLTLPSGRRIILSDTVGFISDLPTDLVAAFRATLEEVLEADILVHVRDIAHPEAEAQKADVDKVLAELGVDERQRQGMMEVLNKTDLLDAEGRERLANLAARKPDLAPMSALTGAGREGFLARLDDKLVDSRRVLELRVALSDGASLAWLYRHGEVLTRRDDEAFANLRVGLDEADIGRFENRSRRRDVHGEPV